MKEKIINYIETLEAKSLQVDDYFKQRNELYIENQKKDKLISSLRQHLIEEHNQKENIIKEVREYIKEHIRKDEEYPNHMEMLKDEYKELLEILDKGE